MNPWCKFYYASIFTIVRTVDEKPLSIQDLNWIKENFKVNSLYFGIISAPLAMITSLILRPWPNNFILKVADYIGDLLKTQNFMT